MTEFPHRWTFAFILVLVVASVIMQIATKWFTRLLDIVLVWLPPIGEAGQDILIILLAVAVGLTLYHTVTHIKEWVE